MAYETVIMSFNNHFHAAFIFGVMLQHVKAARSFAWMRKR